MKENKGVNVSLHPSSPYSSSCGRSFKRYLAGDCEKFVRTQDAGCQVNIRKDAVCTCRMSTAKYHQKARYFNPVPKHIYAYHGVQSNNNIGVSSVKAFNRRRTQRIYLLDTEDRGTGSEDLSSYITRSPLDSTDSYYGSKKASSKCVGGEIEKPNGTVDEKLSPIIKCCNAETGSEMLLPSEYKNDNTEMSNIAEYKHIVSSSPPIKTGPNDTYNDSSDHEDNAAGVKLKPPDNSKVIKPRSKAFIASKTAAESKFSSDSLIRHVHNLELASNNKLSQMLVDPMENKLEREYRQMFDSKTKQVVESKTRTNKEKPVHKSTSLLRKRFEALRRGLKKEEAKNEVVVRPSFNSMVSRKDVSVTSDPPSLEARSYYSAKPYSPSKPTPYRKLDTVKHDSDPPMEDDENSYNQGVLSMFRIWGKKINLEEKKNVTSELSPKAQKVQKNKGQIVKDDKKPEGSKFFFFKRRDKNQTKSDKSPRKNKKSAITNRCKVKDELVHNTPVKSNVHSRKPRVPSKQEVITAKYEEMFCKAWLNKFITNSSESKESAKIRWNNNTYTTSSSTEFELIDNNVYKEADIVRKSKSDASIPHNTNRSTTKKQNFLQQNIEAWMIPKTINCRPMIPINTNSPPSKRDSKYVEVGISKNKWYIDTARTFSRRIELVLHSNNIIKLNNEASSDLLKIDIPKGFFTDSTNSEEQRYRISDEKVFNIVEYETYKSKLDVRKTPNCNTGDHAINEINLTVSIKDSKNNESKVLETVIKRPPEQRDVVIQGSRVFFPKKCNVIGVGIITQMKPILKMQQDLSEDDSEPKTFSPKKKCEFAESYLQEHYRQWMPLGIDLYSSCRSNTKLKCSSEKNFVIPLSQGDGSKSCPDIHDEYQTSATTSSSDTTSDSPSCPHFDDEANSNIFFGKVTKDKDRTRGAKISKNMRMWPKDSTEVFKKRKIYACSNKSKWRDTTDAVDSCCFQGQEASAMCSERTSYTEKKPCCTTATPQKGRCSEKRVSLKNYDYCEAKDPNKTGILAYKGAACETCKRTDVKCSKHSRLDLEPCEIQLHEPPCKLDSPRRKNSPNTAPPKECQEIEATKRPSPKNLPPCMPSPCAPPSNQSSPSPCPPIARASFVPLLSTERSVGQKESPQQPPPPPPPCFKFKVRSSTANAKQPCPPSCTIGDAENTANQTPKAKEQKEKKKKKSKKQVTCDCTLSSSDGDSDSDEQYPCPTNNKLFVPRSPEYSKLDHPKNCPIPDEPSQRKPEKECKSDCANRKKLHKYVDSGQLLPSNCPSRSDQTCCPLSSPAAHHKCSSSSHPATPCCHGIPMPCPSNPAPAYSSNCTPKCPPPAQSHCSDYRSNPAPSSDMAPPRPSNTPASPSLLRSPPPQECLSDQNQPQSTSASPPPQPPMPPSETPGQPTDCPKACKNNKYKLAGLFQKINAVMKKSCPEDSTARSNEQNVARANFNHECSHLKVKVTNSSNTDKNKKTRHQDEDGPALWERKENESQHSTHTRHMASVLGRMYNASSICHRVSTPAVLNKCSTEDKACTRSNTSIQTVANVVEIDFTIKVTEGDKVTNVTFGNDVETEKAKITRVTRTGSREVYIIHPTEPTGQVSNEKQNDINLHVVIKNFKRQNKNASNEFFFKEHPKDKNFSKTVYNKFHTVSTKYSGVSRCNVNQTGTETSNIFSVHRATWDLTCSDDKTKTQIKSCEDVSNTINKEPDATASQSVATATEAVIHSKTAVNEIYENKRVSESKTDVDKQDENTNPGDTHTGDSDQNISEESLTNSNEDSTDSSKPFSNLPLWFGRTKAEKIRMLQIALEKAGKMKHADKHKILKISKMISAIMKSDSTDIVNTNVTCRKLATDLPNSSRTRNLFTDPKSKNNFYECSTVLDDKENHDVKYDHTKEMSRDGYDSTVSLIGCADSSCLCSTIATKLNIPGQDGWCCCRKPLKIKIETNCDISTSEDIFHLEYKTPILMDQATQRSNFMFSKANSFNVSIHNYAYESFVLRNSMTGKELEPKEAEGKDNESSITSLSDESQAAMAENIKKTQLNRETVLKISDENKLILASLGSTKNASETEPEYENRGSKHLANLGIVTAAEVLQCYETKKAVLEIYAERTITNGREHIVAKLPKYTSNKEREIREYGEVTVSRLKQEALSCR